MAEQGKVALVTGATGTIGPVLVRDLLKKGYRVRVLLRSPPPSGILPSSAQPILGDITDFQAVAKAVSGVDHIFHLAAKLHTSNASASERSECERVNVEGTQCITDVAKETEVSRLVFFSTISVYGACRRSEVFDESSPPRPQSLYAETKCAGEAIVLSARRSNTQEPLAVVLRLAAVYGPRLKGNYARLVSALRSGWFIPLGDGCNRRTLVYDEDVSTAALLAVEHPGAAGQVYNVTDGNIHALQDILKAICCALDRKPPRFYFPVAPVRFLTSVLENISRPVGIRLPIDHMMIDKLVEDVAVKGDKIRKELNYQARVNLAEGWYHSLLGQ